MHDAEMMIRKLRVNTRLSGDDVSALNSLPIHTRQFSAGSPIVSEGDRPTRCCFLLEEFACRSKVAETGKRQIVSFHIPGDLPDLQSLFLQTMDHNVTAMSDANLGFGHPSSAVGAGQGALVVAEAYGATPWWKLQCFASGSSMSASGPPRLDWRI